MSETRPPPEYLGDAVYASFDGHQVWLHLNDHRSRPLIALEPEVIAALVDYYRRCLEFYGAAPAEATP